jgi:hypothetical protein
MISIQKEDLTLILSLAATFIGLLVALLAVYNATRKGRYDGESHRAQLEMMRRSVETQIYHLNEKLLATEDRWRDVNHMVISSQGRQEERTNIDSRAPLTQFLRAYGLTQQDTVVDPRLVFVLTPFHTKYTPAYDVIAQVCSKLGLQAVRGDEEFVEGELFPTILKSIARANLVIANIDGRNANVFYELGLAHGMDKTTLLIAPALFRVPFDLQSKKIVFYAELEDLEIRLTSEIARSVVYEHQRSRSPTGPAMGGGAASRSS